jgi:chromosome segregation ATPase
MRYLPRIRTHGLLAGLSVISSAALMLLAYSSAARAQSRTDVETPVEVQSVELKDVEGGSDLLVQVKESIEWTADFEPDGSLVLLLARSVPGPQALDLNPSTGLVANVTVGFSVPDGVPTTRILVRGRQAFSHQIVRRQGGLSVELRASEEPIRALPSTTAREISRDKPQPQSEPESQQPALESQQPAPNGAGLRDELLRERARAVRLERDLSSIRAQLESSSRVHEQLQAQLDDTGRESEVYRQRVSALHADRLQLIEDLRVARELLARSPSGGVAADAGGEGLVALEQERDEARAEVENLRRQLAESRNEVSEARAEAKRYADDLERSRTGESRLAQELDETRSQPVSDSESETVDRLRAQLEQSRKSEADLRGWLARAPRILGVSSMVVSQRADPCLSFRPEPTQSSPVLECLVPGTVVEVLSVRADWLRVRLPDRREGWVGQSFLDSLGEGELSRTAAAWREASEELERLRHRVAELDGSSQETLRLKAELDGSERAVTEAQATIAALQQANARLSVERRQQSEALSDREALQAEVEQGRARIADLEATVATGASSEEELRATLAAAEDRVAELESSSSEQVTLLQAEVEQGRARIAELEATVATGASSEEELRATLAAAEDRVAELEGSSSQQMSALQAEVEQSRARIADLEATVATGASSEEELRVSLAAAEEQLAALRGSVGAVDGLRNQASEQASMIAEMRERIEGLRVELAAAQNALAASRTALQESERAVRDRLLQLREIAGAESVFVTSAATPCLKLRSGPGISSAPFDCLDPGTRLSLLDIEGEWMEVAGIRDERGWVASADVEPESRSQLRQAASELESAQERIAELEAEASTAADEAAAEIAGLRSELDAALEAGSTVEARVAVLDEMRAELEVERERSSVLLTERDTLTRDLEAARVQIDELAEAEGEAAETAAGEIETLRAALEAATETGSAAEEASATLGRARTELEEERRKLAVARSAQDELTSALESARRRISELEISERNASTAFSEEIARLRADLEEARQAESLAEAKAADLEVARDELAVGLEKVQADLAAAADERQRLVGKLEEAEVDQVPNRLAEAERARQQLQDELDAARAREQDLVRRLAQVEDERSLLNQEREELNSRLADETKLESELEDARQRVAALELEAQEISSLRTEVEEAHNARAVAEASVEQLRREVNQLLAQQELLAEAVASEDLENEARRAQVRVAELEAALDASREELVVQATAHGEQLAAAESRLATALAERDSSRQEIAALELPQADASPGSPTKLPTVREPGSGAAAQPLVQVEPAVADESQPFRPQVRSADLVALVTSWAQAWSNQDVDEYLASYSDRFQPASGLSRSRWQEQRRQRLTAPSFIEVEISSLDVSIDGPERGSVTFDQSYRSDTFQDVVRKSLELVLEDGEWRILSEVAE